MLKTKMHIAIAGFLATVISCANASENLEPNQLKKASETIYANEYGKIHLSEINDSLMRAVFYNNEGQVFDTIMKINYNFTLLPNDGYPFLHLKTGGIKVYENKLEVFDFAGPAYMAMYINIENIYDRPFYKLNDTVVIHDEIKHSKGGETIDGIYVIPASDKQNELVSLTGIITKEKYPRAYYSTADSPQGMFSDTTKTYYRLVVKPVSVDLLKKYNYTGATININGQAAFIWEFADSEAYYLDNHQPWSDEELDKTITIEAFLVQFVNGKSVLKNWIILD